MPKSKEIVISRNKKMEMVVIKTPSGLTNRKGEPGMNSKTVHRKTKSKNKVKESSND
jgi:hypothetical protein